MKKAHSLLRCLFLFITISTTVCYGQSQPVSESYESLWKRYANANKALVRDANRLLDTIEMKALSENNEYQQFRTHYERVSLNQRYYGQLEWYYKSTLLYLDSMKQRPHSEAYICLYNYIIGSLLEHTANNNYRSSSIGQDDLHRIDEWSTHDILMAAKRYMDSCFNNIEALYTIPVEDFEFMLVPVPESRILRPTLLDLLVQDRIEHKGPSTMTISLIDKALELHNAPEDRTTRIDYEILKLSFQHTGLSYPIEECPYWTHLESLRQTYGDDEAFDYAAGVALHKLSLSNSKDSITDTELRALAYFENIIQNGKTPYFVNNAQYYKEQISKPHLIMTSVQSDFIPSPKLLLPITYYHVDHFYVSVYPIIKKDISLEYHFDVDSNHHKYNPHLSAEEVKKLGDRVQFKEFTLKVPYDYNLYTTDLWLDSLPIGYYAVILHPNAEWDTSTTLMNTILHVTDTKVIYWNVDKKVFIGANSRTSGEPLAHKRVRTNPIRWHSVYTEHYTNPMGETRVPGKYDRVWSSYDYGLKVCNHHDVYHTSYESPTCRRYSIPDRKKRIKDLNHDNVRIFTDRTLYRPGQPLYFKVLASKDGKVCANLPLEIELRDKHWKTVDSLKMTTSEFGSAAGQFKIPVSEIGHYSLIVRYKLKSYREDKYLSIEVAEFKLPTFKVALEPDTVETGMGDSLSVHGTVTSLNGVPVSGAAVVLNYIFFSTKVKHEVITDAEGRFNDIFLTPAWDSSYPLVIEVVATDVNGETQSCRSVQRIYMEPLHIGILNLSNVNQTKTDTVRWIIRPENHSKVLLPTPIEVRVERLEMPSDYREYLFQDRKKPSQPLYDEDVYQRYFPQYTLNTDEKSISTWPVAEVLFQTTKVCKPDSLLEIDIRRWPMGQYRATFTGTDKFGNAETVSQTFRITRSDLSLTNRFEPIWVELDNAPQRGENLDIIVGSYLRNAVMICDVYQGKRHLSTQKVYLDQEQKLLSIKTRKKGHRSLTVHGRIVLNGQLYHAERHTMFPTEMPKVKNADLDLTLTHWNNLLEPGSEEQWELEIKEEKRPLKSTAELLTWMIDCSLYELGMRTPSHSIFPAQGIIPLPKNNYQRPISSNFKDISKPTLLLKSPYLHQLKYTLTDKNYESLDLNFYRDSKNYYQEVVISWEPPVFDPDNTTSTSTVRGNRSDGRQVIIDGVRVRDNGKTRHKNEALLGGSGRGAGNELSEVVVEEEYDEVPPMYFAEEEHDIKIRSNFVETAFFQPQLRTDAEGKVKIRFTLPDQYSKWQFFALAHTQDMKTGDLSEFVQSRKTLMIQSNAPRFFREGDTMRFQIKISNICDAALDGQARLEFYNLETTEPIEMLADAEEAMKAFHCDTKQNINVNWQIVIPKNVEAVGYRVLAKAGRYGDGEERAIPVLSNRALMTESMHFVVPADNDTSFTFKRFKESSSPTLQHYSYTMEITANPTWLAIQSLPYLMQYRYDCNEQTFSKLYANAIALHIVNHNPTIAETYEKWRTDTVHQSLESPLMKNEQLKNILLEETPWVWNAQREKQQRVTMANLFEKHNLESQINRQFKKLLNNQMSDGGWGWFGNRYYSEYITNHIVAGYRKLQHLGIEVPEARSMIRHAIRSMDTAQARAYRSYLTAKAKNPKLSFYISETDVQYLYARTFGDVDSEWLAQPYVQNLLAYAQRGIFDASYTRQAEVALILHRTGFEKKSQEIMEAIRQQSVYSRDQGMYWRSPYIGRTGCYYYPWYEAPIERQALLIEAFTEISPDSRELEAMKQWLLSQRKGNFWSNTKATAEAIYALLLNGHPETLSQSTTTITVGGETFTPGTDKEAEAGIGYLQHVWKQTDVTPALGKIRVQTDEAHSAFGACYWQYFEDMDKVTAANEGLYVERALFHQAASSEGPKLDSVTTANPIRLGEKITVRLVIKSDRDLEYVHVKDLRASAFEPVNIHERYGWQNGMSYYESPRDAATNFFFTRMNKGTYILEYELIATQTGTFSHGVTTVECMYAPEYRAQSEGKTVRIKN